MKMAMGLLMFIEKQLALGPLAKLFMVLRWVSLVKPDIEFY